MSIHTDLADFLCRWRDTRTDEMLVHTSGSTGVPKAMRVAKAQMRASAEATLQYLGLQAGHTALLCLPLQYIAGQMMVVRAEVGQLHLLAVEPSGRPLATLVAAPHFVAMTPMQVFQSLQHPHDAALLREVRQLIIGGGGVSPELEALLADFPHAVWSTYGMTETLSHIALRRLNGASRSARYRPLTGVRTWLDEARHTLTIFAPHVCTNVLHTNDVADVAADGSFVIHGRVDNVVCSGGVKLQIEQLEARLATAFAQSFALTYVADARLGQALTLVYTEAIAPQAALARCAALLSKVERPQHALRLAHLPLTATDKPARAALHTLAEQHLARG